MNIFNRVTIESLKKNRVRTIVTIIGIILSAAMICAVTTFASSIQSFALRSAIFTEGNWHGRAVNVPDDVYETIASADGVESAIYVRQLGYAKLADCENQFKPYIYLLSAQEGVDGTLPIHITSGEYPKNGSEMLLPNHLATNGGVSYSIGDTITMDVGNRLLDGYTMTQNNPCYYYDENGDEVFNEETIENPQTRTFTVVGFYERLSTTIEPHTAPGYTAFTADSSVSTGVGEVYYRMDNPGDTYTFMSDIGLEVEGDWNTDVLTYEGVSRFDSFERMLYSLVVIIVVLIMFGSVSLIYNAFAISVSERTKQFGLLSSVGATKKQLSRMVLFEALVVSAIGVPLGIIAGIAGIGITLLFLGDKFTAMGFHTNLTLSVSPLSVLIAAAVALVTVLISAWIPSVRATRVSAVEAIRLTCDINATGKPIKTSKLMYRLFGLPGMLAGKHFKRNKKKYRATVVSLFMSIVLFVSASSFTHYLMDVIGETIDGSSYDISFFCESEDFEDLSPDELLSRIKTAKSVTEASHNRMESFIGEFEPKYISEELQNFFPVNNSTGRIITLVHIAFIDDEAFGSLLDEYRLDSNLYTDPEAPFSIAVDRQTTFMADTERYEKVNYLSSDRCELEIVEHKEIDGYYYHGEIMDESGNAIYRYVKEGTQYSDGDYIDLTAAEALIRTPLSVGTVIDKRPYSVRERSDITLIYPMSLMPVVLPGHDIESCAFMINSDNHMESFEAVKSLLNESGFNSDHLVNYAQQQESERNAVTIIRVFSYGFIVLISLIAAANVFNTISTNISLRRREFAMLKSVGMSSKDFSKMMNFECLLYGTKALVFGLPVAAIMTYFIWRAVSDGFEAEFSLPWGAIGISVLSVFVVVFATMVYAMSKIKKDNPIDALKNENL